MAVYTKNTYLRRNSFKYASIFVLFFYSGVKPHWKCANIQRVRGSQRDVVYLGWQIVPSYISLNAGGGRLRSLSQWVQRYTWSPNTVNFRDPTPIVNLWWRTSPFSLCEETRFELETYIAAVKRASHLATLQTYMASGYANPYLGNATPQLNTPCTPPLVYATPST